jgi:Tol biopolymer transport system component
MRASLSGELSLFATRRLVMGYQSFRMRSGGFVFCFIAALVASLARVAWAQMAYDRGKMHLFVLDEGTHAVEKLDKAEMPGMNWNGSPEWSHDGTRIAFDATPEDGDWLRSHIALYHFSGPKQGKTEDLGLGDAPTWSADDKRIAFFLNPGTGAGKAGTWMMKADGSDRTWLCEGWFPNWSPDEKSIVCTTQFGEGSQLLLYDVMTGGTRLLTSAASVAKQPAWSPDSKKLAALVVIDGRRNLVVIDVERDEVEQLLWHEKPIDGGVTPPKIANISWMPKRQELLVSLASNNPQECPLCVLGIGKLDRLKSDWRGGYHSPAWSADGKRIAFCSNPLMK